MKFQSYERIFQGLKERVRQLLVILTYFQLIKFFPALQISLIYSWKAGFTNLWIPGGLSLILYKTLINDSVTHCKQPLHDYVIKRDVANII